MKALIVSDVHGDHSNFESVVKKYQNDKNIDLFFYNGDSEFSNTDPIFNGWRTVVGNMDISKFDEEDIIEEQIGNTSYKILQVHGHLFHTEVGLERLLQYAKEKEANIVLSGHTHELMAEQLEGILFINPGSLSLPRGKFASFGGTYAMLELLKNQAKVTFYQKDNAPIDSLTKVFNFESN